MTLFLDPYIFGCTPQQIQKNNLVKCFDEWGPEFFITFELFVNSWTSAPGSILVFGNRTSYGYGWRAPFLCSNGGQNSVHLGMAIGDNPNKYQNVAGLPTQHWINMTISQSPNEEVKLN